MHCRASSCASAGRSSYSSVADLRASTWVRFSPLILPPIGSPALEAGLALLVERQNALAPVFGRDHPVVGLDLKHHAAREIHLQAEMDRVFGLAHRDRGVVGDAAPGFERLLDDAARRAEAVDHAPFVSLGGGERASRQDNLLGPAL